MLKHLKFLILLVLPFSLAMTLTSCSDDDNENLEDGNEETSLLVGSWEWEEDEDFEIWTFNSDGTCKVVDGYVGDPNDIYIITGKYSYDASTGILLINLLGEKGTAKYKVLSISSSELVLQDQNTEDSRFGEIYTYNRKI